MDSNGKQKQTKLTGEETTKKRRNNFILPVLQFCLFTMENFRLFFFINPLERFPRFEIINSELFPFFLLRSWLPCHYYSKKDMKSSPFFPL